MSDEQTPLEAAVQAYAEAEGFISPLDGAFAAMRAALRALVRAAVECPTCKGTGRVKAHSTDPSSYFYWKCSADHATFTVFGETIYGDPDKCEWRCVLTEAGCGRPQEIYPHDDRQHKRCGWQPQIQHLFGGE
jgi:hypothetical protein